MFDRLIESGSVSSPASLRNRYFALSGAAVAAIVIVLLLLSLFASDFEIGAEQFEMSALLAPVVVDAPEPPKPDAQARPDTSKAELPSRQMNILRVDENIIPPTTISTTPNKFRERPPGQYIIGPGPERDGKYLPGSGNSPGGNPQGTGSELAAVSTPIADNPPPPRVKNDANRETVLKIAVVNGKAIFLPKPPYPRAALLTNIEGEVNVQVMIDETGKVTSSKAVSGHPLLRSSAERSAWDARFAPTTIRGNPVKVTGMIIYRFSKN